MSHSFKQMFDHVAAFLAVFGVVVDHVISIVAGCMAISWYVYRFLEARRANGNK